MYLPGLSDFVKNRQYITWVAISLIVNRLHLRSRLPGSDLDASPDLDKVSGSKINHFL